MISSWSAEESVAVPAAEAVESKDVRDRSFELPSQVEVNSSDVLGQYFRPGDLSERIAY